MREILFRGKNKQDNRWLQGDFHSGFISGGAYINGYEVDPSTVGQYIGLTDKAGKRIFEGDIIRWKDWNDEYRERDVRYDVEWGRFCVWLSGAESSDVNKHLSADIEVIGNIYDKN